VAGVNKLERLLNLTAILLDTRVPLTAEDIRQRVEGYPPPGTAFHRAFERDKDDLRELGIPLRVERVLDREREIEGYRIPPDEYYLPDPGLEPDELAALHLASLAVRIEGVGEQEALWKLGGLADPVGEVPQVAAIPADERLGPIFGAITERHPVRFRYRDEDREVEPHRLDFRKGRWYLTGYDRSRADVRNFRVDRIDGPVAASGEPGAFERPAGDPGLQLEAWRFGDEEPVEARLLVDASRAAWARRLLGEEQVAEQGEDGSMVFTVPVVNRDAFRSFVLDLLDHAEVLGPAELRDDLVAWLAALAGEEP
jgi:proteasome accessory factor B